MAACCRPVKATLGSPAGGNSRNTAAATEPNPTAPARGFDFEWSQSLPLGSSSDFGHGKKAVVGVVGGCWRPFPCTVFGEGSLGFLLNR